MPVLPIFTDDPSSGGGGAPPPPPPGGNGPLPPAATFVNGVPSPFSPQATALWAPQRRLRVGAGLYNNNPPPGGLPGLPSFPGFGGPAPGSGPSPIQLPPGGNTLPIPGLPGAPPPGWGQAPPPSTPWPGAAPPIPGAPPPVAPPPGGLPIPGYQGPHPPGSVGPQPGASPQLPPGAISYPGWHPFENNPFGDIGALLAQALMGNGNYGGYFSPNPPQGLMSAIRQQSIQDAGAQERAARNSLYQDPNADPSTFGFQSLMSQLQGQSNTSRNISQADLAARSQQLQQYWNLLNSLLNASQSGNNALIQANSQQTSPWGGFLGGLGGLIGGLRGIGH